MVKSIEKLEGNREQRYRVILKPPITVGRYQIVAFWDAMPTTKRQIGEAMNFSTPYDDAPQGLFKGGTTAPFDYPSHSSFRRVGVSRYNPQKIIDLAVQIDERPLGLVDLEVSEWEKGDRSKE